MIALDAAPSYVAVVKKVRYRYRLRVNATQAALLQQTFDTNRAVWNKALTRWSELWKNEHLGFSYGDAAKQLTAWRGCYAWLATSAGRIALRVVWTRDLPSPPGMVTVKRDKCGRWWASFTTEVECEGAGVTGFTTGLDVGLTTFATTEFADADVPNPRFARRAAKALARSQRNLARKKKGSNNRTTARTTKARVESRIANQRSDWQHKQARILARRFDRIGIEDLQIKNMSKRGKGRHKKGLNRSIADAGWGQFGRTLEWHATKCGHEVVRLPARNTTQTCSMCGAIAKPRIELSDRVYHCSTCGMVECRDRNAARNLNPNRRDKPGAGVDGVKTTGSADLAAA